MQLWIVDRLVSDHPQRIELIAICTTEQFAHNIQNSEQFKKELTMRHEITADVPLVKP